MTRLLVAMLAVFFVPACARPLLIPPPQAVRSVAVLPPNNRTGYDLVVAGASLLEKYALDSARLTVPDLLADEARELMRARGYRVLAPSAAPAASGERFPKDIDDATRMATSMAADTFVLYLDVRRWEPDADSHPAFVIVGVSATLIEAGSGRVAWSAHPQVHPVRTTGAPIVGVAYEIAARAIVTELLASWPTRSPGG